MNLFYSVLFIVFMASVIFLNIKISNKTDNLQTDIIPLLEKKIIDAELLKELAENEINTFTKDMIINNPQSQSTDQKFLKNKVKDMGMDVSHPFHRIDKWW